MLHKILAARSKPPENLKIIADFDSLIVEPVGFVYRGKSYEVKPVDTESFLKIADCLGHMNSLLNSRAQGAEVTDDVVYESYYNFITPLCPTFTMKDLKSMKLPQLGGLVNLIIRHLTGETVSDTRSEDSEKKKTVN